MTGKINISEDLLRNGHVGDGKVGKPTQHLMVCFSRTQHNLLQQVLVQAPCCLARKKSRTGMMLSFHIVNHMVTPALRCDMHCGMATLGIQLFNHNKQEPFYTKRLLHQTALTPNSFYTKQLLYQAAFHQRPLHFTPTSFCQTDFTAPTPPKQHHQNTATTTAAPFEFAPPYSTNDLTRTILPQSCAN